MKKTLISLLFTASLTTLSAHSATPPNTLVVVQSLDDAISFDPAQGFETSTVQAFTNLYQRLLQSDPAHPVDLRPTLASSWKAGSDNRSLTFTLQDGATFASGNPIRPEDVIFSLSRVIKLNLEPSFVLTQLGWNAKNIDSQLTKTSANQVTLHWDAAVSPAFVLSLLSAPVASIVDEKEALSHQVNNDLGHQWLSSHSAGSGPYQIRRYVPHEVLLMTANPRSPGGAPKLSTLLIKNVPEAATRRLVIEQGDADIARNLGSDQFSALQHKPGVTPVSVPIASLYYLLFNTQSSATLKNPAFWEASRYLFDYDGIANGLLKGQFSIHQSFLPSGYLGALNDTPYTYNPEKAKAILAKAGLSNVSFKVVVNNQPPYLDIAQALQASFAKGGVKIELIPSLSSEVTAKMASHQFDATVTSWGPDYFDPNTNAAAFATNPEDGSSKLAYRAGWHIPELTAETQKAVALTDNAQRAALYEKLQRQVQKSSPYVIGLQAHQLIALRSNIKGYQQGMNPDMVYYSQVTK
ncbi:peptide/nickel transport system substrate-binding protein [Rosenbergiella nectarea]|uniref:Peptide/nickel transport system substrate-binding protein n=1 Tax=Rosenbergiella nectarea TaxID=988801 RepID=A0A1H9KCB6_9GAMM|nr:ABC transporter substrate-binding protein [Rosenbergiella nectarea]SEQ96533.1 peptide/nickel transport system substrate-binding protein [Rosenbergiella nectarea]